MIDILDKIWYNYIGEIVENKIQNEAKKLTKCTKYAIILSVMGVR